MALRFVLRSRNPIVSSFSPRLVRGLEEFFENGQALPYDAKYNNAAYGRGWTTEELETKSFDDLHSLWYTCLKELNVLMTQEMESRATLVAFLGRERRRTVKRTMANIKCVLHKRDLEFWNQFRWSQQALWGVSDPLKIYLRDKQLAKQLKEEKSIKFFRQLRKGFRNHSNLFGC